MKAVLFARVACSDLPGIPANSQLERLREYAKAHDMEIVDEITQVGVADPTPPYRLSEYLRQHTEVSAVLTTESSRVMPTKRLWDEIVTMITRTNAELHFVLSGAIWIKDHLPLIALVHSMMDENYSNCLREAIRKGQTARAHKGRFPGRVPFGYRLDHRGALVEEPAEAAAVRNAYELFANGHTNLRNLQQALSSENGIQIPLSTLKRMLKSRFYLGQFLWDGRQYTGNHPVLVDRVTFELVQMRLSRPREKHEGARQ